MDVRLWSRELISEFIDLYRSFPCLWKTKSEEYKNKNLRENALSVIVNFCKDRGFPEANRDFVSKKIQSLRGSFRKELKKVTDSERSGRGTEDIYTPSLWYFDQLMFTKEQEVPSASLSNLDNDETHGEEASEEGIIDGIIEETTQEPPVTPLPTVRCRKRKVRDTQEDFMRLCTTALQTSTRPVSDFEAVGINLSSKLAKMQPAQAIYAESLVGEIIRRGLLNKLTEDTDFCENGCNRRGIRIHGGTSWTTSSLSTSVPPSGDSTPGSASGPRLEEFDGLRSYFEDARCDD